jgi:hypothetical protein
VSAERASTGVRCTASAWRAGQSRPRGGAIANILKAHGLEPAPERNRKTTWKEFLLRHWEVLVAADFFTIEVWTRKGLTRYVVLFLIDLSTRRVEIAGIAAQANGLWMAQVARNLSYDVGGFLMGKRYLIHDRDTVHEEFPRMEITYPTSSRAWPRKMDSQAT